MNKNIFSLSFLVLLSQLIESSDRRRPLMTFAMQTKISNAKIMERKPLPLGNKLIRSHSLIQSSEQIEIQRNKTLYLNVMQEFNDQILKNKIKKDEELKVQNTAKFKSVVEDIKIVSKSLTTMPIPNFIKDGCKILGIIPHKEISKGIREYKKKYPSNSFSFENHFLDILDGNSDFVEDDFDPFYDGYFIQKMEKMVIDKTFDGLKKICQNPQNIDPENLSIKFIQKYESRYIYKNLIDKEKLILNPEIHRNIEALECLIQAGAELNMTGHDGKNPLDNALSENNLEAVKKLKEAGARSSDIFIKMENFILIWKCLNDFYESV